MVNRVMIYNRATEQPCYDRLGDYGGSVGAYAMARVKPGVASDIDYVMLDQFFRPLTPKGLSSPIVTKVGDAGNYNVNLSAGQSAYLYNTIREIHVSGEFGLSGMEVYSDSSMSPPFLTGTGRHIAAAMVVDSDHGNKNHVYLAYKSVLQAVDRETRLPIVAKGRYNLAALATGFDVKEAGWSYNATLKRMVGVRPGYVAGDDSVYFEIAVFNNVDLDASGSLADIFAAATYKKHTIPKVVNQSAGTAYGATEVVWAAGIEPVLTDDGRIWFMHRGNNGYLNLRVIILGTGTDASISLANSVTAANTAFQYQYYGGTHKMQSRDGSTVALFQQFSQTSGGAVCFVIDKRMSFYYTLLSNQYSSLGESLLPFGDAGWALYTCGVQLQVIERFNGSGTQLTVPPVWCSLSLPYMNGTGNGQGWWISQVTDYSTLSGMGI